MTKIKMFLALCFSAALYAQAPPEPPRVLLDTHYVAPTGRSITVLAGGDLQSAIDSAVSGDEIVLQAGAKFVGNFVLKSRSVLNVSPVVIRSSRLSDLPEGTRVSPANVASMATLSTPNVGPALDNAASASQWRLAGIIALHVGARRVNAGNHVT
jgi:hypothetical protein